MQENEEAKIISKTDYQSNNFKLENQKIIVENMNSISNKRSNDENTKTWGVVSNKLFESQINASLNDYKTRTELIDTIVSNSVNSNISGVIIDFSKIEDQNMQRLLIELTPKLREIGISTCLVMNENIKKDDYKYIVDFIIE